jgi:predicted site-specific integrase-resolvase
MPREKLLRMAAAERETDIPAPTLRRWARTGKIKAVILPSGQLRIRRSTLSEIVRDFVPPPGANSDDT